ncbi:undecaprenyl-diphosphate phosphatase [Myxococcota bacterium]|nr:undecaprenyl-diphosphate phosphatase [Myxococcota bacterium]
MTLAVLLLALVEGLTEFLPVSSTGHLVVVSSLLGFDPAWREPFLVVIQFGAILAVVVDRRKALLGVLTSGRLVEFGTVLFLGFLPSAALGLAVHKIISGLLKNPIGVSAAWIVGGVLILVLDRGRDVGAASATSDDEVPRVTKKQAVLVGLAQCLSLWPGMSRSASTILGGLAVGLDRKTATLFSFYLAIPTMFAASGYELLKFRDKLDGAGPWIALGMVGSFLVAWATVRWLLRYVETHTFRPFAIYRIVAGLALMFLPASLWE